MGKRSGFLEIVGKRNKYREVPLNATARKMLQEYLSNIPAESVFLFPSGKTTKALSERMLGYIVKKYATHAKLTDVSPHDLRHRFGYRMAEAVPLHRLAQIMGHDLLDTTRSIFKEPGTTYNRLLKRSRGRKIKVIENIAVYSLKININGW